MSSFDKETISSTGELGRYTPSDTEGSGFAQEEKELFACQED
jgi:hypothetical protein